MRILKKLSVSTVFGRVTADQIAALKNDPNAELFVGRFYGNATGSVTGQTQFGSWVGLTGAFRAVDGDTGELCQGTTLLLPMGVCEMAADALKSQEATGEIPMVSMSVDIYMKYRLIAGEDKYEYLARSNEVPKQEDPLEKLAQSLGDLPVIPGKQKVALIENKPAETTDAKALKAPAAKTEKDKA